MKDAEKPLRPVVTSAEARHILGIHPSTFARLDRAGVFRRRGYGFEAATLASNYARALEIEAEAKQKLAALGQDLLKFEEISHDGQQTPDRTSPNSLAPLSPLNPSEVPSWQV